MEQTTIDLYKKIKINHDLHNKKNTIRSEKRLCSR